MSGIFDPFGLGTGFSEGATLPLKPLNTPQQASKETSPQQSSPQPTQVTEKQKCDYDITKKY